ncbi:uncharacterized protein [Halyomorpha halys]|uniref:uncharacterized protein isoform X2 n=1 Tax=Halyomorpha halys TaxID=286706 RepID=UPI0006D4FBBC|nr:uncharacterized protein LOC106686016 isoform X1 [Halyomorpha halys]
MAQCSGKHISAMQLFYELKQRFPHIPDRLVNYYIKQARGDKEACWCMLEGEKPRMSEPPAAHRLEVPSKPSSPIRERPRWPPVVRSPFMPPSLRAGPPDHSLIQRQLERKQNLELELEKEKRRLAEMQRREQELKSELNARLATCNISAKAKTLTEEISVLRSECLKLSRELESHDEDSSLVEGIGDSMEQFRWCCHMCTFQNHPLLNQCEYCLMPRVSLEGGDTQNIHIHVTHHNFPSCMNFW